MDESTSEVPRLRRQTVKVFLLVVQSIYEQGFRAESKEVVSTHRVAIHISSILTLSQYLCISLKKIHIVEDNSSAGSQS